MGEKIEKIQDLIYFGNMLTFKKQGAFIFIILELHNIYL